MASRKIKLTKKQKKEIKTVIKKWLPGRWQRNKEKVDGAANLGLWGSLGAILIGTDVVVTGGAVSASMAATAVAMDAMLAGAGAGLAFGGALSFYGKFKGTAWKNQSGQTIWSPYPVKNSLVLMEKRMSQVFNELTSLPEGKNKDKKAGLTKEMQDIVFDAEALEPLIHIFDPKSGKSLKEEFKFRVKRSYTLNVERVKNANTKADNDNVSSQDRTIKKFGK